MRVVEAIALGVVQGLTEFLPISSSGHLIIVRWAFGWELGSAAMEKSFDAATHLGTAIAALVLSWQEVYRMGRSLVTGARSGDDGFYRRLFVYVLVASVPAGAAGLLGESLIEERLGSVALVAAQLAFFGLVLFLADRLAPKVRSMGEIRMADAVVVGLAQVLALSPGVSRSGITITAGLGRGLDRPAATRFSFLLLLPVTAGAGTFKFVEVLRDPSAAQLVFPFVVGIATSAVTGYVAARVLLALVRTKSFLPFVVYRLIAAGVVAVLAVVKG